MLKNTLKLIITFLLLANYALAEIFPRRTGNVDVVYTDNTYADLATKVWMIDHAQKTVDIASFMFGLDQYGLTVVAALRRALNRGVDVRVMYEGTVARTLGSDPFLRVTDLLVDPSLKKQAQVINMGAIEKSQTRLAINDYIHEKLFLVDVLTENEMIYFGGRDLSEFSRITIDSGYFMRPVNRRYYYVGDDVRMYYNTVWTILRQYVSVAKTNPASVESALKHLSKLEEIEKTFSQTDLREFQKIVEVLQHKPQANEKLKSFQFRPDSVQLVTNDLIKKLIVDRWESSLSVRRDLYAEDDILKTIIQGIEKSKKIEIVSYSSHFVPPLQHAFQEFIKKGELLIYTNGKEAMASMDAVGISAVSYDYTTQSMRALVSEKITSTGGPKLEVNGLDRNLSLRESNGKQSYLHRKLILFDDRYVLTGSYNFTESSSSKNDEMIVVIDDKRMNAHHASLNHMEKAKVYKTLELKELDILNQTKNSIKRAIFGDFVKSQY